MALKRQLTLLDSIPYAIGSIIGSGILFLPSMTYSVAGSGVFMVWVLAIFLCLPGLVFFSDIVSRVQNEEGMSGFVTLGLGSAAGSSIPILLLATVSIGMPAASYIAGQYAQNLLPFVPYLKEIVAFLLLTVGILSNLLGVKVSSKILFAIATILMAVGVALIALTTSAAQQNYSQFISSGFEVSPVLKGTVLAFWAFAGFENMTFMAGDLKNPRRDLLLSVFVAVISCGLLYLMLSLNYASLIPFENVDNAAGLFQLAETVEPIKLTTSIVVLFAIFSVAVNMISWTAGISRAIYSSAHIGMLPKKCGILDQNNIPKNATLLLGLFFLISFSLLAIVPSMFDLLLSQVSTNFLFIYILGVASYFIYIANRTKKAISGFFLIALVWIVSSSKALLIYPLIVFGLSIAVYKRRIGK